MRPVAPFGPATRAAVKRRGAGLTEVGELHPTATTEPERGHISTAPQQFDGAHTSISCHPTRLANPLNRQC